MPASWAIDPLFPKNRFELQSPSTIHKQPEISFWGFFLLVFNPLPQQFLVF